MAFASFVMFLFVVVFFLAYFTPGILRCYRDGSLHQDGALLCPLVFGMGRLVFYYLVYSCWPLSEYDMVWYVFRNGLIEYVG